VPDIGFSRKSKHEASKKLIYVIVVDSLHFLCCLCITTECQL